MNNTWRLNFVQNSTDTPTFVANNVNYLLTFQNTTPYKYTLNICNFHILEYTINNDLNFNKIIRYSSLTHCPDPGNIMFFDAFASNIYTNDTTNIVPFQLIQIGNSYSLDIFYDNKRMNFGAYQLNQENFEKDIFKVFPNPTSDKIFLNSNLETNSISIFNPKGQKVYESYEFINEIDISNFSNGLYFLKLSLKNGTEITKKIVKN